MNILRYQIPAISLTPPARLSTFQGGMDRLFEGLPYFSGNHANTHRFSPALDVYQDENNIVVHAELPGMKKGDIALSLCDGLLILSGERRPEQVPDEKSRVRNERFFGRFERTITLPVEVDSAKVAAAYENGILTVTLPKAEATKPRQIEIAVK